MSLVGGRGMCVMCVQVHAWRSQHSLSIRQGLLLTGVYSEAAAER